MLVLTERSASGKSSVARYFADNFGFSNIVAYTTRKPRDGEINGIDYHFISKLQFETMLNFGLFAATAEYNKWNYGFVKKDFENGYENKIAVLTPHGIRQIKKNGLDIYTAYIKISRRDRLIKILQRGDNIEEAYRRNLSDKGQFDGIEDEADLIMENSGYNKSIQQISEQIKSYYYLNSKLK